MINALILTASTLHFVPREPRIPDICSLVTEAGAISIGSSEDQIRVVLRALKGTIKYKALVLTIPKDSSVRWTSRSQDEEIEVAIKSKHVVAICFTKLNNGSTGSVVTLNDSVLGKPLRTIRRGPGESEVRKSDSCYRITSKLLGSNGLPEISVLIGSKFYLHRLGFNV